jgi:uncharacterized protein YggT (Ycf19 family)
MKSGSRFKVQSSRSWTQRLWTFDLGLWTLSLAAAILVTALALRFAMRALGVRDDIPFPGLLYSLTAPVVQPFYRFFPLNARFDYHAVELASLAAAGSVLAVALVLYIVILLIVGIFGPKSKVQGPKSG